MEIHHDGDLPARTGLGSSSSFTVGLLNSLYALLGKMTTEEQLAKEAIHIEQTMCGDTVGCQDQILVAYGGLNYIEFGGDDHLKVNRVTIGQEKIRQLQDHLMLFFTGFSRTASTIAKHQIQNIPAKQSELTAMYAMAQQALTILLGDDLHAFGKLLDESWQLKRSLSDKVSTPAIDDMYAAAKKAGASRRKIAGSRRRRFCPAVCSA